MADSDAPPLSTEPQDQPIDAAPQAQGDGGNAGDQDRQGQGYDHQESGKPSVKLYVGHLGDQTTRREVEDLFTTYGTVKRVDLKVGYGFVEFENVADAEVALNALNNYDFHGRSLRVEYSLDKKRQPGEGRCFICNGEGHWAKECTRGGRGGRDDRDSRGSRYGPPSGGRYPPSGGRYERGYSPRRASPPRGYDYSRDAPRDYPAPSYRDSGYGRRSPPRSSYPSQPPSSYRQDPYYPPSSGGRDRDAYYRDGRDPRDTYEPRGGDYYPRDREQERYPAPERDRDYYAGRDARPAGGDYGRGGAPAAAAAPAAADAYRGGDSYRGAPSSQQQGGYGRDRDRRY